MAYINIFVANQASVTVKNNQLLLKNVDKEESFPLEDISCVMFENLQTNISLYTMSMLAQNNVTVYVCNQQHLPCAYLLPFNSFYSPLKTFQAQTTLPAPLRKQLWKDIVINKILNQDRCLRLCKKESDLNARAKEVLSDDSSNMEAVSANIYFKALFGKGFTRSQENDINSALNYGYSVLRGEVARNLVSCGLLPFLGLKHKSTLNNFNLADDLMEVFRPYVDLFVYQNTEMPFDTKYKARLVQLLGFDCHINNANYSLSYGIKLFVQSFVDSITQKENLLKFPTLKKLSGHEFR